LDTSQIGLAAERDEIRANALFDSRGPRRSWNRLIAASRKTEFESIVIFRTGARTFVSLVRFLLNNLPRDSICTEILRAYSLSAILYDFVATKRYGNIEKGQKGEPR